MRKGTRQAMCLIACFSGMAGAVARGADGMRLTEEGRPAASIVISSRPSRAATLGAVELRDHIRKISGAALPIVADKAGVTGTRILVGESAATRALGLKNADFQRQEYMVGRRGDSLVLMGHDDEEPFGLRVTGPVRWVGGREGRPAMAFDGVETRLLLDPTGFSDAAGSLEIWVNRAPGMTNATLIRLDGSAPWSYHIVSIDDKGNWAYVTYDGKTAGSVRSREKTEPGWRHLRAAWSAADNRMELFIDGQSVGSALYKPTHCAQASIQIGSTDFAAKPSCFFKGALSGFRLCGDFAGTQERASLPLDEGEGQPGLVRELADVHLNRKILPDPYACQGTSYAVYTFLERFCGVRWYGPTEICTVIPDRPTLDVQVSDIRRLPSMAYRNNLTVFSFGQLSAPVKGLWNDPTPDEMWVYLHRMRNGGEAFSLGHSFPSWYDRFWEKNPRNPDAWVEEHPEWFAHGYKGRPRPTQVCYSSDAVVSQTVADARAFFDAQDGKKNQNRFYALGPDDNDWFCKCAACIKLIQPRPKGVKSDHFSNGRASDYWFTFCNRVARELRRTHPDKYVSALTYSCYAAHPGFQVEPNIALNLALEGNMCIDDPQNIANRHIWELYGKWVASPAGQRPIVLYLYTEFPEAAPWGAGYTTFPGFRARLSARQIKRYVKDNIFGILAEFPTTQLNQYMYNQLTFDAEQDAETLINEFFDLYYGSAAAPMRKLWLEIEEVFTSPENWPLDPDNPGKDVGISERTSWRLMGTTERMSRWAGYMSEATAAARTETEKARVALFRKAEWEAMVRAKQQWDNKASHDNDIEALKQAPPPSARIARLKTPAAGDAGKVDWGQVQAIPITRDLYGYPAPPLRPDTREVAGEVEARVAAEQAAGAPRAEIRLAHDGRHLYVWLREHVGADGLAMGSSVFTGDGWELFWAAQRDKPYRQVGITPRCAFEAHAYGELSTWESGIKIAAELKDGDWTTILSLPMTHVVSGGLKSGQTLYFNAIRHYAAPVPTVALSPHFVRNHHVPERLAALVVE